MIPSAPSSAENLSPVPVRKRGRVPINKTIFESQRKSPFCSRPLCFPRLYFYKRAGPRPTAFTQRSQLHIVAAMHAVLVLAAPPTLAPEQATPSSSPISAGNELSTGGKGGGGFQTKIAQTHTLAPPAGGGRENTQQRHCKEQAWRPGASDTGLLCAGAWPLPAQGPAPQKKRNKGGGGVAEARWSDEGKPDGPTDTSLFQESQEDREADPKERWRGGERPALPRATTVGEGQLQPSGLTCQATRSAPGTEAGSELCEDHRLPWELQPRTHKGSTGLHHHRRPQAGDCWTGSPVPDLCWSGLPGAPRRTLLQS